MCQMILTKQRYGKEDKYIAWHGYQSFKPGEVTPERCHEIGVKLAREMWGDSFQVIVTIHLDKLELTEQEAKIYDEVMEQIEKTAALLVGLSHEERLDWLREHQYSLPISFEREVGGTVYTVKAHFSGDTAEPAEDKVTRILNRNITR